MYKSYFYDHHNSIGSFGSKYFLYFFRMYGLKWKCNGSSFRRYTYLYLCLVTRRTNFSDFYRTFFRHLYCCYYGCQRMFCYFCCFSTCHRISYCNRYHHFTGRMFICNRNSHGNGYRRQSFIHLCMVSRRNDIPGDLRFIRWNLFCCCH